MLWGWDATESSASIEINTFEDDLGDIQEETFYKFTAASYRNYDNKTNDKNIKIESSTEGDEDSPHALFIKFGFRVWGEDKTPVVEGQSKFYFVNAMLAMSGVQAGLSLFMSLSLALM